MSLTTELFAAARSRAARSQPVGWDESGVGGIDEQPIGPRRRLAARIDPPLRARMERVVERDMGLSWMNRLVVLGETQMRRRVSTEHPPAEVPATRRLPVRSTRRAPDLFDFDSIEGSMATQCSTCGGGVDVDVVDLETGYAKLRCRDCGRHWEDRPVDPLGSSTDSSVDIVFEGWST